MKRIYLGTQTERLCNVVLSFQFSRFGGGKLNVISEIQRLVMKKEDMVRCA